MTEFDVIIIGSGPGGAITARQCALAGLSVLVIEKGGKHIAKNEFGLAQLINNYKHSGMTSFLGSNPISYVEGSVLGGGSVVNAGLYHKTPETKLNDWINSGCLPLSSEEIKCLQEEVENTLQLEVTPNAFISEASLKLAQGAKALNWECVNVPRWYSHKGERPSKNSMNTLIHEKLQKLPNVKYLTKCEVFKIVEKNNKVLVKIKDELTNETKNIFGHYTFVCAGAIDSPTLLKRSGYLKRRKIFIGCHPSAKIIATYQNKLKKSENAIGPHQIKEFFPDFSLGCSISSKAYIKQSLIGSCAKELSNYEIEKSAIYYANIENRQNRLYHFPLLKNPILRSGFDDKDFLLLKDGLLMLARVLFKAGAISIRLSANINNHSATLDEFKLLLEGLLSRNLNLMTIHLFASLPMGPGQRFPVEYGGRLKEATRIYVNDSSIFPSPIGANPQGTVMMLALNNVNKFLKDNKL